MKPQPKYCKIDKDSAEFWKKVFNDLLKDKDVITVDVYESDGFKPNIRNVKFIDARIYSHSNDKDSWFIQLIDSYGTSSPNLSVGGGIHMDMSDDLKGTVIPVSIDTDNRKLSILVKTYSGGDKKLVWWSWTIQNPDELTNSDWDLWKLYSKQCFRFKGRLK